MVKILGAPPAWLVVRVFDAAYAPTIATVLVSWNDRPEVERLAATSPAGVGTCEIALPRVPARLKLEIAREGCWPFQASFQYTPEPTLPTLDIEGPPPPTLRALVCASRGGGWSLEVHVVLSQLRSALERVLEIARNPPPSSPPRAPLSFAGGPQSLPLVSLEAIVGAAPAADAGPELLRHARASVPATGKLYAAERPTDPKLVFAWRPAALDMAAEAEGPLDFHVFFHPDLEAGAPGEYPFDWEYASLAHRYLFAEKRLVYQHEAARKKAVLVFPVGSRERGFGHLPSERNLLRLLQELSYWLPRMDGARWPRRSVGRVAVSGFGSGVRHVERLLATRNEPGARDPRFEAKFHELYAFDAAPASPQALVAALKAWLRGKGGRRVVRFYHREPYYGAALGDAMPGKAFRRTFADFQTYEEQGEKGTLLIVPTAFWSRIDRRWGEWEAHNFIPNLFLYHAVARSGFAPI